MKLHRFVYQLDYGLSGIPVIIGYYAGYKFKTAANGQGYGSHTKEQLYEIGKADLKALNGIIGESKFLMGDQLEGYLSLYYSEDSGKTWNSCKGKIKADENENGFSHAKITLVI